MVDKLLRQMSVAGQGRNRFLMVSGEFKSKLNKIEPEPRLFHKALTNKNYLKEVKLLRMLNYENFSSWLSIPATMLVIESVCKRRTSHEFKPSQASEASSHLTFQLHPKLAKSVENFELIDSPEFGLSEFHIKLLKAM